nr:sugar O-acetyltransferase [Maliibacterium massiliense]
MTEKERMRTGALYSGADAALRAEAKRARSLTRRINATTEEELQARAQLFGELFGRIGPDAYIEPPFRCDYGSNIYIGRQFYANYDCILVDVCAITIGDNVFFGPRVCVYTAAHPIDAAVRATQLEYGKPVTIGSDVWIGGNSVINPGVTIGDDVVIGAGSVVTRDIPAGVVAVGNPCRVLRTITEAERAHWHALAAQYHAAHAPCDG